MEEKLSLEEFYKLKKQLIELVEVVQNFYELNISENILVKQQCIDELNKIYDRLSKADLSDIPPKELQKIDELGSDFSKAYRAYTNPLSDNFSSEFKEKCYSSKLTIGDLVTLSSRQIDEIKQKNLAAFISNYNGLIFEILGIERIIQLYKYSSEEYELVNTVLNSSFTYMFIGNLSFTEFSTKMQSADIKNMKEICYSYIKNNIFTSQYYEINIANLPELFVKENSDILLTDPSISEELRKKYYSKVLTLDDIINNINLFEKIPVEYFMNIRFMQLSEKLGSYNFKKILKQYPKVIKHVADDGGLYNFVGLLKQGINSEENFIQAVKKYFLIYDITNDFLTITPDGNKVYNIPDWLASMNFSFVPKLEKLEELMEYNSSTIILDKKQQDLIDIMGIDNIRRFEQETNFFSHREHEGSYELEVFDFLASDHRILFNGNDYNDNLSYEEYVEIMATYFHKMRKNKINSPSYDWIKGEFRDKHPDLFIDENVPEELKKAFYINGITAEFLYNNSEYVSYLLNRNLSDTLNINMKITLPTDVNGYENIITLNFVDEYIERYGNEKFLKLILKYGPILSNIEIDSLNGEIDDEYEIERALRRSIYKHILNSDDNYSYLVNIPEFVSEYSDIFADFSVLPNISDEEKKRLEQAFYDRSLKFADVRMYPQLVDFLKEKNLKVIFKKYKTAIKFSRATRAIRSTNGISLKNTPQDLVLIDAFGNEEFLKLCSIYGRYIENMYSYIPEFLSKKYNSKIDFSNIIKLNVADCEIEKIIIERCLQGDIRYLPYDVPEFLKEQYPQLFLSDDAPEELKECFYGIVGRTKFAFKELSEHKEWLPYLKGKYVLPAFVKSTIAKVEMKNYFELFGDEKALKLGVNKPESVTTMIFSSQVDLMKKWYDKTGQKFIPDSIVMQNFPIEEADKFLLSIASWGSLMKLKKYSDSPESREAMLKLVYSFGIFDHDQSGLKKLQSLLTDLPRTINSNYEYTMSSICSLQEQGEVLSSIQFDQLKGYNEYMALRETLLSEGINLDENQEVFSQIYRKNNDCSYTLTINPQSCPKSSQLIRTILETYTNLPILTPDKAHQLFGGFMLKYDRDFREFLLANMEQILETPEYTSYISNIQKQFSHIRAVNSNRRLTLNLAVSYLQSNKYDSIEVGNERAAEISAIAGYSQDDFDVLQQIYNYGKQRTFSSIPRIEETKERYTYEILRLDDPLAMAIGTLTDCCQELGNAAEVCMEHSMVDKNGRVFVIKDECGNIVAQSWVWRNKDVLCFDNIEIPNKAFERAVKGNPELGRTGFTEQIYEIYRQAAHDLIVADELIYAELLESGKINEEQYEGLRLGKVTVGLGYNDIVEVIEKKATFDKGIVSTPLPFKEPVKLSRGLYLSDSRVQYILEQREDRTEYMGDTLSVHNDTYTEYSDSNFNQKMLLSLEKLEAITKNNSKFLQTQISDYADLEHIVTELARNYRLNQDTTRIVMNPNFAIIYDINGDTLRIGDLLFNTKIENETQKMDIENQVAMQIRLALEQIASGKKIDISELEDNQIKMYEKAIGLSEEIDIERGIGHAK